MHIYSLWCAHSNALVIADDEYDSLEDGAQNNALDSTDNTDNTLNPQAPDGDFQLPEGRADVQFEIPEALAIPPDSDEHLEDSPLIPMVASRGSTSGGNMTPQQIAEFVLS